MDQTTIDRAAEIANETMATLKAKDEKRASEAKKAEEEAAAKKVKEETKGASTEESATGKEKTEGEQTDDELVAAAEDSLTEEQKVKKAEIIEKREKAKTPEQKLADWQEKTQKRIDELSGQLKAEKASRKADLDKITQLEEVIAGLEGKLEDSGAIETELEKISKDQEAHWAKLIEKDKDLPREKRREMSKDDIEEFLLEDNVAAHEWMVRRELRRQREIDSKLKGREVVGDIKKHEATFFEKFPGCNMEERGAELESEGKSQQEIIEILCKESPDFKLMIDVVKANPKLNDTSSPSGLEALMKAMEAKRTKPKTYTEEQLQAAAKEAAKKEQDRLKSLDVGPTNTIKTPVDRTTTEYKTGLKLYIEAGKRAGHDWTEKDYLAILAHGKKNNSGFTMPGVKAKRQEGQEED